MTINGKYYLRKKRGSWIPGFCRRNLGRKVVAVFFAVLLYYYVHDQLGVEAPYTRIPVEIELPARLYNGESSVPSVTVVVKGSAASIGELSASDIHIRAAVREENFRPGMPYILPLTPDSVQLPGGLRVVRIEPQELRLEHLEEIVVQRVPVAAEWNYLNPAPVPEYTVAAQFVPASIPVSGPESLVKTLRELKTTPIPIDLSAPDNFTLNTEVMVPPGVNVPSAAVEAHVEILRRFTPRSFRDLPVLVLDSAAGRGRKVEFVNDDKVEVEVTGPPGQVALLRPVQLRPYVDVAGLDVPGEYTVDVECRMADDAESRITRIFPSKVKVKIANPANP